VIGSSTMLGMDQHSVVGEPEKSASAHLRGAGRMRFWPLVAAGFLLAGCQQNLPHVDMGKRVDVIAHEGGRGLYFEESLGAFQNALDLGVDALDLDVVIAKEQGPEGAAGYNRPAPLVWNAFVADAAKCSGPGVGQPLKDLTFAQVYLLNCDKASSRFPGQKADPGSKIALLGQVFDLVDRKSKFTFDVEVRTVPNDGASPTPEQATSSVVSEAFNSHREGQVRIKSFDWRNLAVARQQNSKIQLVAMYDERTFFAGSPWLGPVDYNAVGGDPVKAAQKLGAEGISPCYTKAGCAGEDEPGPGSPLIDKALVDRAHAAGLKVFPWTVNDKKAMSDLIDMGVDGIVTDYPDRLRDVLRSKGLGVPETYKPPFHQTLQKNLPGLDN
jgi:glycerophosphoryl diester phosphodiesterase